MRSNPEWAKVAARAAEEGGRILSACFGRVDPTSIEAKRQNDWVSAADRASEAAIIQLLRREAPGHAILTEEAGYIGAPDGDSRNCWIIDPLDGTTNFLRGLPIWAVSVALEHRPDPSAKWGSIIAGAVAIPLFRETFWAAAGDGAWRNGGRFWVAPTRPFCEALLGTGFPFRVKHIRDQHFALFNDLFGRCADIRRPGAAAMDLCYTALGVYDGFWELDLSPWDVAAGGLIITEAGGRVSNFQGGNDYITSGDIVAGKPGIFEELLRTVTEHFPQPRQVDKSPRR